MKTKSLMHAPMVCLAAFLCAETATAATLGQGGTLTLDGGFGGFIQLVGGPGQIIASPIFSSVVISSGQIEGGCICAAFGTNIWLFDSAKLVGTVGGYEYWYWSLNGNGFLSPPLTGGPSISFSVNGGDLLELIPNYQAYGSVPARLGFSVQYNMPTPLPTPLPATLPLFAGGLGLMGLLGWCRKRKARTA